MFRSLIPSLLLLSTVLTALPPKDQALLEKLEIKTVRPLAIETVLVDAGKAKAAIIAPKNAAWQAEAQKLQAAIKAATGCQLPLLADRETNEKIWQQGNLIILGNLLNSKTFFRLYGNFFVCTDGGYCGTEGYELRSTHEPFGPGCNVIAVGAQHPDGLARAVEQLAKMIRKNGTPGTLSLPRILDLKLERKGARTAVPKPLSAAQISAGKKYYEKIYASPGTERAAASRVIKDAMSYHRSGDEAYLELFRYGMKRHIQYYRENEYINEAGLARYDRDFRDSWTWKFVVTWDLLEEHPTWSDAERLLFTNHILRCILECNMYQHWTSPETIESWRNFSGITHNHHTWPGLANLFGGWYFQRHYRHPRANDWLTIAKGMFNGCKHSSKPWEDSAGYQWIPQGHVLVYSYASGDLSYITEGHAALTAKTALMCLDSLGHQPAFGDHSSFLGASRMTTMLSALDFATRDGSCRWALDRLDAKTFGELLEPYYTDVKPKRPDHLVGTTVSYLPPPHYALNGNNPDFFPKANIPFEESFDKLTLRSGWEENDDYLLLDGYSGGSHGHQDCNAIIGYTSAGAHWLVDGEYIRQMPKYHCAVTVVRDGVAVRNPAMARLDDALDFGDGAIVRTTIPDYNGIRWTRNIFWKSNSFLAVIDQLTATRDGDYSLRCCWRTYGNPELKGNTLSLNQEDKHFELRNLSRDQLELIHIKNVGKYPVSQLYQRQSRRLKAGESISFVNVLHSGKKLKSVLLSDETVGVLRNGKSTILGLGTLDKGGIQIKAEAWMLDDRETQLASATHYGAPGQTLWSSPQPSPLRIRQNLATSGIATKTPQPGQRAATNLSGKCKTKLKGIARKNWGKLLQPQKKNNSDESGEKTTQADGKLLWHYQDFPRTPVPLEVVRVRCNPEPVASYSPRERLIDGLYTNSRVSCLFPKGEAAAIEVDLGKEKFVSKVRIRAWEMNPVWHTKNRRLEISADGKTWSPAGEPTQVGTESWGNNVNIIYELPIKKMIRSIRFLVEPKTPDAGVYLAEIQVIGNKKGALPKLTALTAVAHNGKEEKTTVVGTEAGNLVAISPTGEKLWSLDIGSEITVLASGCLADPSREVVVYGTSDARLGILSAGGEKINEVKIPKYRGIHAAPQNLTIADLDGNGTPSIVVGCKSWQYHAYSPSLEKEWSNVIYAHSATVAEVADLDGDGKQEIVAGNAYYRLNIIGSDGKRKVLADRFGPEQTAAASGDLDGDKKREVLLGTDAGDVIAFTQTGKRLWVRNAGDRITTLHVENRTVFATSESGFIVALDPEGKRLWQKNLGSPIRRLLKSGDSLLCATATNGVFKLTTKGDILSCRAIPTPLTDIVATGKQHAAILANGTACAIK